MELSVPENIIEICAMLERSGHEACVVGGCVRDRILGRTPNDWDVCTSALPEETKACFSGTFRTVDTGLRHGTVTVVLRDGQPCEVTTYRVDGPYSDRRRPDTVEFVRSLDEDLARRDFTVNAMAYRPCPGGRAGARGVFRDPFGGRQDLKDSIIRTVGSPEKRFGEDALRILRAVRFSAVLGARTEPETERALVAMASSVQDIAAERITVELKKLLAGRDAEPVLVHYRTALADMLGFPVGSEERLAAAGRLSAGQDRAGRERGGQDRSGSSCGAGWPGPHAVLAAQLALLFDEATEDDLCRLKFDRKTIDAGTAVRELEQRLGGIGRISRDDCLRLLRDDREDDVAGVLLLRAALGQVLSERGRGEAPAGELETLGAVLSGGTPTNVKQLAVTGRDLQDIGIPRGPDIGKTLRALLSQVQCGTVENTREALLREACSQCADSEEL